MKSNNNVCTRTIVGLSVATSPFIVTILTAHILAELMSELGKLSEELFRPERLPILNFPDLERE